MFFFLYVLAQLVSASSLLPWLFSVTFVNDDPFADSIDNEAVSIQCSCVTAVTKIHYNAPDLWNNTGITVYERQTHFFHE